VWEAKVFQIFEHHQVFVMMGQAWQNTFKSKGTQANKVGKICPLIVIG
jgi:hypothetical protein